MRIAMIGAGDVSLIGRVHLEFGHKVCVDTRFGHDLSNVCTRITAEAAGLAYIELRKPA